VASTISSLQLRRRRSQRVPLQRSKENAIKSRGGEETRGGDEDV